MRSPNGVPPPAPPSKEPHSPGTRQGREKARGQQPLRSPPCLFFHRPSEEEGSLSLAQGAPGDSQHPGNHGGDWEDFWEQQEPAGGGRSSAAIFTGLDLAQDLEARDPAPQFSICSFPWQPDAQDIFRSPERLGN